MYQHELAYGNTDNILIDNQDSTDSITNILKPITCYYYTKKHILLSKEKAINNTYLLSNIITYPIKKSS